MGNKAFRGEVWTNAHPEILQEMLRINGDPVDGKVGNDGQTQRATELMQSYFHDEIRVVYTMNGTAANILAMKSMLDRWGTIICEENTHINTYECGAFESMLGNKILSVRGEMGKLNPSVLESCLARISKYSYLPQAVVITQPTELGVLYTNAEIKAICDLAHAHGMYVYIDGARLSNALVALDTDLTQMIEQTDVDAFSFGGTTAGAMFGEMVVFRRKEHFTALSYLQKQALQHLDKSKFLGVQMEYLLRSGLWKRTAAHANAMAKQLEHGLREKAVEIAYPVDTNMVFCILNPDQLKRMNQAFDVTYWNAEQKLVRLATTFETDPVSIDTLLSLL